MGEFGGGPTWTSVDPKVLLLPVPKPCVACLNHALGSSRALA